MLGTLTMLDFSLILKNKTLLLIALGTIILVIIIFIFALLSFFNASQTTTPTPGATPTPVISDTSSGPTRIVAVLPQNGSISGDYTGSVSVVFDKSVSVNDITITLSPIIIGTLNQKSSREVAFTPSSNLTRQTEYGVHLESTNERLQFILPNGTTARSYEWSFTTDRPTGEETFTEADKQNFRQMREIAERAHKERLEKIPFLNKLPYSSSEFTIEIATDDTILVTTHEQVPSQTAEFRQKAVDWLVTNGGNLGDLEIEYTSQAN